jgi:hypothetical protein
MSTSIYKTYERNLRTVFEYYGIDKAKNTIDSWYQFKEIGYATYQILKGELLKWMN